jgi:hypothetical protein
MLKVRFTLHHPTLDFDQVRDLMPSLHEGSNYKERMIENYQTGILLRYREENVDNELVHVSYWKDKESNDDWTDSIYDTPETLQMYRNLESAGFTWTIVKEEVESMDD